MTTTAMRSGAPTVKSWECMFTARIMVGSARVALPIPRFIAAEMVERLSPTRRHRPRVAVARIEAIVYVAVETVGPVKPGAGSEENSANEPVRPIVAVRSAVIRT